MGNDGILPIICETTRNANMADVIHCQSAEVISEGTWKSLIFFNLSTMWDYKRRACPKTHGLQARLSDVQHYICFPNERSGMCNPGITPQQATGHQRSCKPSV